MEKKRDKEEEEDPCRLVERWIEETLKGKGRGIEIVVFKGLQLQLVNKGLLRAFFIIPPTLSDEHGNWHVGALATLIDNIAALVAVSSLGNIVKASVDFNLSYYSTPKINEEVEIEGRVVAERGKLVSVVVEVKKKETGELIALARQWFALFTNPSASKL